MEASGFEMVSSKDIQERGSEQGSMKSSKLNALKKKMSKNVDAITKNEPKSILISRANTHRIVDIDNEIGK